MVLKLLGLRKKHHDWSLIEPMTRPKSSGNHLVLGKFPHDFLARSRFDEFPLCNVLVRIAYPSCKCFPPLSQ